MKIYYDDGTDLLYLRFDEREQQVENRRLADDIVLDIGEGGKFVGIEILDASQKRQSAKSIADPLPNNKSLHLPASSQDVPKSKA